MELAEIQAKAESLTLEQLQDEKNARDAQCAVLISETRAIHALMEPLWAEEQRRNAGPANLRQVIGGRK